MDGNGMQQLIDDYLDGSADESEMAQLKAWLEADAANLEVFAREVFFHQQLRETLVAQNTARFLEASNNPEAMDSANKPVSFPQGLGAGGFPWSFSPIFLLLIAACALASSSYLAFHLGWKRGVGTRSAEIPGSSVSMSPPAGQGTKPGDAGSGRTVPWRTRGPWPGGPRTPARARYAEGNADRRPTVLSRSHRARDCP